MTSLSGTSHGAHFGGMLSASALAVVLAGCLFLQSQQTMLAQGFVPLPVTNAIPQDVLTPAVDSAELTREPVSPLAATQAAPAPAEPVAVAQPVAPVPGLRPSQPATVTRPAVPRAEPVPERVQLAQAQETVTQRAEFIVKLRPSDEIDAVIAGWRRDKEASRAAFQAWAEGDPLFSGMELVGCSYSGELILSTEIRAPARSVGAEVDALVERLRAHAAVRYADPDFIANPALTEN